MPELRDRDGRVVAVAWSELPPPPEPPRLLFFKDERGRLVSIDAVYRAAQIALAEHTAIVHATPRKRPGKRKRARDIHKIPPPIPRERKPPWNKQEPGEPDLSRWPRPSGPAYEHHVACCADAVLRCALGSDELYGRPDAGRVQPCPTLDEQERILTVNLSRTLLRDATRRRLVKLRRVLADAQHWQPWE